ncbi:unnamed protein product [Ilex paraguariensis]|uniref:Glutaredoxin domain-containing protein n=1 Tax=Ilex paraguariensis TaxID=185542 RepID=A0ABC8U8E9_9AQUA
MDQVIECFARLPISFGYSSNRTLTGKPINISSNNMSVEPPISSSVKVFHIFYYLWVVTCDNGHSERLVADKPVVIFSKSSCCMCHTIKSLICSFGANPTIYELDELPNGQQIERALKASGREPVVPIVFIGEKLIGGSNEVMSLHVQGKLVPLLIEARAIWVWQNN